jgi:uncharacterized phage protein (TIGR01671 family)
MSREIKFRVWKQDISIMCYGYEHYISDAEQNNYPLMQFMGLKDMNGQDIYDGDILQCEYIPSYFAVEWNNEASCYDWYVMTETKKLGASFAKAIEDAPIKTKKPLCQIIEVIGNIYENPDLLI